MDPIWVPKGNIVAIQPLYGHAGQLQICNSTHHKHRFTRIATQQQIQIQICQNCQPAMQNIWPCTVRHFGLKLFRHTNSPLDWENLVRFVHQMHMCYREEKQLPVLEVKDAHHAKDPKRLWATFNGLLGCHNSGCHSSTPLSLLLILWGTVQTRLAPSKLTPPAPPPEFPLNAQRLPLLSKISSELRSISMSSAPKSCELDPLPTTLIQDHVDDLLPLLTLLCNKSVQEAYYQILKRDLSSFRQSNAMDLN